MQPSDPNGSPIEYPTITYSGIKYTVKFSNYTLYLLDKQGIDLKEFGERLKSGRMGYAMIYDLLAASIQSPVPIDVRYLVEGVPMAEASQAVIEAMGKVQPPADLKLRETAASPQALQ